MGTLKEDFEKAYKLNPYIKKAFEERKLVFFIGAGVSRLMGLPGWDELSTKLIKLAYSDYAQQYSILSKIQDNKQRITIAYQKLCSEGKKSLFYKEFGRALRTRKKITPENNIYKLLTEFSAIFLTTNADKLFEEELGIEFCHQDLDYQHINNNSFIHNRHLFYLHGKYTGKVKDDDQNLVFTVDQYVKKYNDATTQNFLRAVLNEQDNVIIFIGYGLNEFELIDYMFVKSGNTASDLNIHKKYIVEGFCSNEEAIYGARKSYFDALGIEIIPYNMDKNGYNELIHFLKMWVDEYKFSTKAPLAIKQDIDQCTKFFSEQNANEILRYINSDINRSVENSIVEKLIYGTDLIKWIDFFWRKQAYSFEQLKLRATTSELSKRNWPLLSLVVVVISEPQNNEIQNYAKNILIDLLLQNDYENFMSKDNYWLAHDLVRIIVRLDRAFITDDLIFQLNGFVKYYGFRLLQDYELFKMQVCNWKIPQFQKFLNVFLTNIGDIDAYSDFNAADALTVLNFVNKNINGDDYFTGLIGLFVKLIEKQEDENRYYSLKYIEYIDSSKMGADVTRTMTEFFSEFDYAYSQLTESVKKDILNKLLDSRITSLKKIALYFIRTYNIGFDLIDFSQIIDNKELYPEIYLCLKKANQNNQINKALAENILSAIKKSNFGIAINDSEPDEFITNYIKSKRLGLAKLLPDNISKEFILQLEQAKIEPYEVLINSTNTNDGKITNVNLADLIDSEKIKGMKAKEWPNYLKQLIATNKNYIFKFCEIFVKELIQKKDGNFNDILKSFRTLPDDILLSCLLNLDRYYNELVKEQEEFLIDFCIDSLCVKENFEDKNEKLVVVYFRILSKYKIVNNSMADKIKHCFSLWANANLNEGLYSLNDSNLFYNFLNSNDKPKFDTIMRYYFFQYETNKKTLKEEDYKMLSHLLLVDKSNFVLCYLCFNIQNLLYISEKNKLIFDLLFYSNNQLNILALVFSTLNCQYVFDEVRDLIIDQNILANYKDEIIAITDNQDTKNRFYRFVASAYFLEKLSIEVIEPLFDDYRFIDVVIHLIASFMDNNKFDFSKTMCEIWAKVRTKISDGRKNDFVITLFHLLQFMNKPTLELLQIYEEVLVLLDSKISVNIDYSKLIQFFAIDNDIANNLILKIICKINYLSLDDVKIILQAYETDETRKTNLLNTLVNEDKITLEQYELLSVSDITQ